MSSLRNILQRCARNVSLKSILGGTPLQIYCTFIPVYSAYPTGISRQAYSSDANEANKNAKDPLQKFFLERMNSKNSRPNIQKSRRGFAGNKKFGAGAMPKTPFEQMNAKKSRSKIPEDEKASKLFTADSAQKTPFEQIDPMKSTPNVTEDENAPKSQIFNKNLNLRKYYIGITGLSNETTPASLREFYSQFGEIAVCKIVFQGERNEFGSVAFTSRIAMDDALNSLPHCIDGKEIRNVRPGRLDKRQLSLQVTKLSPKTTTESLRKFYSRFGMLNAYYVDQGTNGKVGNVTFANQKDMHRALDAQPHVIDGSEVFLRYATFDLDFEIIDIPEFITEEDLIAFYSKYGQLRRCQLLKGNRKAYALVSYSAVSEINRALDDRPHVIGGKPLEIKLFGKYHLTPVSLFVGSLPENVTEETLREELSKYGKPIYWELKNDGRFNQSRPYGIVTYSSEHEALKVLKNGPHTIEGSIVDVRKAKDARRL